MSPLQQKALRANFGTLQKVKIGAPLPSERELAAEAGVTRTVIRGLLASLAAGGLVRRKGRSWIFRTSVKEALLNLASENPVSRRQEVKNHLLAKLGSGRMPPGQRITESAIAKELGVATISVREALLEMMPLGVFLKNRSRQWEVIAFTPEKIAEMREFREMVELFCLRKLVRDGLSPAIRLGLEGIREETQKLANMKSPSMKKMLEVDLRFHRFLLEASGNELVAERAEFIYLIISFQLVSPFVGRQRGQLGLRQHLTIIDGILAEDLPVAEKHLLAHLQSAEETFCSIVRRSLCGLGR